MQVTVSILNDLVTRGYWLLAYEAPMHKWLEQKAGADEGPVGERLKRLRARDVRFYDPDLTTLVDPQTGADTTSPLQRFSLAP